VFIPTLKEAYLISTTLKNIHEPHNISFLLIKSYDIYAILLGQHFYFRFKARQGKFYLIYFSKLNSIIGKIND